MTTLDYLVRINGSTLSDLGVDLLAPPSFGVAGAQRSTYSVPDRYGQIPATVSEGLIKTINLRIALGATTTIANRQSDLDTLLAKLTGLLEIELGQATDRIYWGYVDTIAIRARFASVAYEGGDAVLDLPIMVPQGTSVARSAVVLAIGTSPVDVRGLGVLPSAPLLVFHGAVTDLVVDYQTPAQVTVKKLTLTGTVAADEFVEIDCGTQRITVVNEDTGTRTLTNSLFDHTVTDNAFPIFDPRDGVDGEPPLIEADVDGFAYYAPRYP